VVEAKEVASIPVLMLTLFSASVKGEGSWGMLGKHWVENVM